MIDQHARNASQEADTDLVVDRSNAWSQPRHPLGFSLFCPRTHFAPEDGLATLHLNRNGIGVKLSAADQCILYVLLQICWRGGRLDGDQIGDALHAPKTAYGFLRLPTLVLPLDFAFEGYPAFLHRHVNLVDGNRRIPVEYVDDSRSDIGVGPFCPDQAHFNIVGNRRYSVDAKGSLFGPPFFHKGIHISSQRDDTILGGDADFTSGNTEI